MAENYTLWQVKKSFVDKYTKRRYKSGEVAVFERERAAEIAAILGESALLEVDMPGGFCLTADGDVEQDDKKTATRRGKGGSGSKDNKKQ